MHSFIIIYSLQNAELDLQQDEYALSKDIDRSSCVRVAIPSTVQRIKSVLSEEGHQITNWSVAFCTTLKWLEGIHLCPSETGEGL